jgi:hypothetical protein
VSAIQRIPAVQGQLATIINTDMSAPVRVCRWMSDTLEAYATYRDSLCVRKPDGELVWVPLEAGVPPSVQRLGEAARHLQRRLAASLFQARFTQEVHRLKQLGTPVGERAVARLFAASQATRVLSTLPVASALRLTNEQFCYALALHVGLPGPGAPAAVAASAKWGTRWADCSAEAANGEKCGCPVYPDGYHFLWCRVGGHPIRRHNEVVATWARVFRSANLTIDVEPTLCADSHRKGDIRVANMGGFGGADTVVDVTMVVCACDDDRVSTAVSATAQHDPTGPPRNVALRHLCAAEEAKRRKYADLEGFSFVPLACDHFGALGQDAAQLLKRTATCALANVGVPEAEFVAYWRAVLEVTTWRAVAQTAGDQTRRQAEGRPRCRSAMPGDPYHQAAGFRGFRDCYLSADLQDGNHGF